MKNLHITFGKDLSAYAETTIDASSIDITNIDALVALADNCVFEPEWDTQCALRVVSIRDDENNYLIEDMAIEPCMYDAGQNLQLFLRGAKGHDLKALVKGAVKAVLIEESEDEVFTGSIRFPGYESRQVDFTVRKGATQEEKDVAFLAALAQIAEINYRIRK